MDNNFKETVGKMRSLMERVEGNMSPYEATINEEMKINEAASKNRVQVSRDEILDILDQADNEQNEKNTGKFATITYVNAANVYKRKSSLDAETVNNALNKHSDKSEEDWHQKLSNFIKPETKGSNPITSVITVNRYTLKWHSPQNYAAAYNKYYSDLTDLRQRNGIANDSAGVLGDNKNIRDKSDTGAQFNQTGKMSRDFNFADVKMSGKAYFVNEDGHVVSEIPDDVVRTIVAKKKKYDAEASVSSQLTGPALDAYIQAKKELDAKFNPRNLLFDKILCICCGVNGVSYYYINDKLITNIAKGSDAIVNQNEMIEIAKELLNENFDVIQGFAN